jgi:hypothetical protein
MRDRGIANLTDTSHRSSSPFIQWLFSRYAVSWVVAFLFVINNFVTGFAFPKVETPQTSELPAHFYDLLFGLSGAIGLLTMAQLVKVPTQGSIRKTQIVLVWIGAAIFSTLIPLAIERILIGHSLKPGRISAAPYSLESALAQFAVFTIFVASISEMRLASTKLATNRHKLRGMQLNLKEQLASKRTELERQIATQIDPVIDELRLTIESIAPNEQAKKREAIPQIRIAIDQVIRPLSHTLVLSQGNEDFNTSFSKQSISQIRREISRASFRHRWLVRVPLGSAFEPIVGTLGMALFVLPSMSFIFDVRTAVTVGIPALMTISVTSQLLHKVLARFEMPFLVVNLAGVLVNLSSIFLFFGIMNFSPKILDQSFVTGLGIGVAFIMSCAGYFGLVVERRFRFLDQAREANDGIVSALARMRHELFVSQRQLGRLLHGGVQARLQSATLRMSRSQELTEEILQQVISDIDEAKSLIQHMDRPESPALGTQLDGVIDFWDGVCEVNFVIPGEFDEIVSRDFVATQCTIEVVREAIANAVKHGQAQATTVELSLVQNREIEICVSHKDQSDADFSTNSHGLGSHIFGELTKSWSLSKNQTNVVFRATVPYSS